LFISQHNRNQDAKVQHLAGVAPKTLDWFVREALQGDVKNIIVDPIANETFPPDFNLDWDMEPVGKYYQVYLSWG
jgi:hypothetical protein